MTVGEFLADTWSMLVGRGAGPMSFRLIMQPAMAAILAVLAGLKDAREGRPPYLWTVVTTASERRELIRRGWKDIGRVFLLAVVLDVAYELVVFRRIYPGQVLLVAVVLAIVPYLLIRGPVTRIARRWRRS